MISDEKVRVRFVTKVEKYRITDAPFSLPSKLGRSGLSEVINHLLDLEEHVPFDFMIAEHLIRLPLQKFLAVQRVSTEDVISIEYFPATTMSSEGKSVETPAWIGSINSGIDGLIVAGCYDGTAKIYNSSDLSEVATIEAHEDPIRAITSWSMPSSSAAPSKKSKHHSNNGWAPFLATASKDQTVKCWNVSDSSNVAHVATLSGYINSVESLGVWRPTAQPADAILLTGDWTGTLFGWNVSQLGAAVPVANADEDAQDRKKRKKASDFMNASAAGASVNTSLKPLFTIKAHAQAVSGICSSGAQGGKSNSVYTSSWDHALKEWDLERQDCSATFASSRVVTSIDCSSDAGAAVLLATAHPDGRVRIWDPRQAAEASVAKQTFGKSTNWMSQVKWRPDSAQLFAATDYSGKVTLWDMRTAVPLSTSDAHQGKALCLDWLAAGKDKFSDSEWKVLSGGSDCVLRSSDIL